jgi:Family of unknown function (DUF5715)
MRILTAAALFAALSLLAAPLRAGHDSPLVAKASSQAVQNARADAYNLSRMRNAAMVRRFYRAGYLVRVPASARGYYLQGVPSSYRYLRPWTLMFLDRLSGEYQARFGERLRVTSLVRTVAVQDRLEHVNPNAADAVGASRSSHLTGATLDISKRFMSARGQQWMRRVLYGLQQEGFLYAIEEFQEPNFHIMVYPDYREYVARITGHSSEAASNHSGDAGSSSPSDTQGND